MYLLFSQPSSSKRHFGATAGFGLTELLISIAIVSIVMGVVLARQDSFNSAVLLRSQAYEIALNLREVQVSANSVVGFSSSFRTVLGVHFDTAATEDGRYHIFRDADGDYYFDASEAYGAQQNLDSRFEILEMRTYAGSTTTIRAALSVVFERPNFDAQFFISGGELSNVSKVEIDIANRATGDVRTVEVTATGQIAVQ